MPLGVYLPVCGVVEYGHGERWPALEDIGGLRYDEEGGECMEVIGGEKDQIYVLENADLVTGMSLGDYTKE